VPDPLSYTATLVLQALHLGHRYGFEIMRVTELPSGTVYPALRRLEGAGLVVSDWEDEAEAHAEYRPARRYYRLSGAGATALDDARARVLERSRLFDRAPAPGGGS
jgi:PadR family transcriptional regulator, regulatory protein PadR